MEKEKISIFKKLFWGFILGTILNSMAIVLHLAFPKFIDISLLALIVIYILSIIGMVVEGSEINKFFKF
jgi:hypothetical protein